MRTDKTGLSLVWDSEAGSLGGGKPKYFQQHFPSVWPPDTSFTRSVTCAVKGGVSTTSDQNELASDTNNSKWKININPFQHKS